MSKSLGNFYTIEDVINKGFDPMALRYFYLTAHYRKSLNFTWEALSAAQSALRQLRITEPGRSSLSGEKLGKIDDFRAQFDTAVSGDMNMPQALAVAWEVRKSNIPERDKFDLLMDFDEVLGLRLSKNAEVKIPDDIYVLAKKREDLRKQNKFSEADILRKQIEDRGYLVEDTSAGFTLRARE